MDNNQSLRLYSEKEVRALLKEVGTLTQKQIDWHINELYPIELPSDEDILKESDEFELNSRLSLGMHISFEMGAKWVIGEIKQQADGTK